LEGRAALSEMAAAEIGHFAKIEQYSRARHRAGRPREAVRPALRAFHASTPPRELARVDREGTCSTAPADLYSQLANWLDESTKHLVLDVLADTGHSAFAEREVRRPARPTACCATG